VQIIGVGLSLELEMGTRGSVIQDQVTKDRSECAGLE